MGRNKGLPKQLTEKQELLRQQDKKIQELRALKEEWERECELLRGRIFHLMQEEARK